MIFYFSGTGNSYYVAKRIAESTHENMVCIPEAWGKKQFTYELQEGERIGFVYPIHAWAPPTLVKRFIRKLKLSNAQNAYIYSVLTCGDTYEGAVEHLRGALHHIGLSLQGSYTMIMPNDYVMGHELDEPEVEDKKLVAAEQEVGVIINGIMNKKVNYSKEKFSFFKSYIIYASFQCSKLFPLFKANDQCVGCGLCEKVCPMHIITMKERKSTKQGQRTHKTPSWSLGCTQCSGCINICPQKAINYLPVTKNRRRYFHSEYKKYVAQKK